MDPPHHLCQDRGDPEMQTEERGENGEGPGKDAPRDLFRCARADGASGA